MKHIEKIQKKKWIKPELKTLGFKQTFGGSFQRIQKHHRVMFPKYLNVFGARILLIRIIV